MCFKCSLPLSSLLKILYAFLIFIMQATCPVNFILLHLIIPEPSATGYDL